MTMMSVATTVPRISVGLTSDKYTGTTSEAAPIPRPTMKRPTMRIDTLGAAAIKIAPTVNRISAMIIVFLRPIESYIGPAIKLAMNEPARAKLTTNSF